MKMNPRMNPQVMSKKDLVLYTLKFSDYNWLSLWKCLFNLATNAWSRIIKLFTMLNAHEMHDIKYETQFKFELILLKALESGKI